MDQIEEARQRAREKDEERYIEDQRHFERNIALLMVPLMDGLSRQTKSDRERHADEQVALCTMVARKISGRKK
jgi:hypothetical protein